MSKKNNMSVAIGVAFVWFTTQFGGGFASGAQLKVYFIQFGILCFVTPIMAQAIGAFYQWYALKYATKHKLYDYRSFNDSFYGKLAPIFSNIYEVLFFFVLCLAPSVAFATGGATLKALSGMPYILCTAIIGVFIFIVAVFGTNIVRKVASTLSILIIVGLLVVFIPNIIAQWGGISENISAMAAEAKPAGPALWKGLVYAFFQLSCIGLYAQHAQAFKKESEARTSMIWGFFVNSILILISVLGLLAIVQLPEYAKASVPVLTLVQNGIGAAFMTPIISVLIILGAVSTAVNMVAAITQRVCAKWGKTDEVGKTADGKPTRLAIVSTLVFTLLAFGISQFGLIPLVAKGYGFIGYLTIPVIVIPFIIHMIVTRFDSKSPAAESSSHEKVAEPV